METTVKQRLITFIDFLGISSAEFQRNCGLSSGFVNNISKGIGTRALLKIESEYPQLNTRWLITGQGPMTTSAPGVVQNNFSGNNNYLLGGSVNTMGAAEEPRVEEITDNPSEHGAPIIPSALVRQPNTDILIEMKKVKKVEYSAVRAPLVKKTFWYRVTDHSMEPKYEPGDELALWPYEIGNERVIPGKPYAVDTNSNGLIVGILFPEGDGFRVRSKNSAEFPDFIIEREDIIRIYRIMLMIRQ